ncbi:MAG: hypothetical protein SR2Q5_02520 [Quinella sp. 2Q5]|nr:hypothetical protein [Quinella sp. 2Q5]
MNNLKREAIALIESIPDERSDVLIAAVKNLRALIEDDDEIFSRAEQDLALMEDIETLTRGGDVNGE